MKQTLIQATIGLVVVIAAFVGGTALCEFCIPGTMGRYLTEPGELVVGGLIYCATLAIALRSGLRSSALFMTAAFVPVLIVVVCCVLVGSTSPPGLYWPGLLEDTLYVCRHTAFPVLVTAVTLVLLRSVKTHHNRSPL